MKIRTIPATRWTHPIHFAVYRWAIVIAVGTAEMGARLPVWWSVGYGYRIHKDGCGFYWEWHSHGHEGQS